MVRGAFPIFSSVSQNASIQTLTINSPVGAFGLRELGLAMKLTGVQQQGDFGMRMAMNGLTVPQVLLPPWSRDLVPTDLVLDLRANGYDLQAALEEILSVMRANVRPDESKAAGERAVYALAPDGKVKIALGPSQFVSKLLAITFEGEMTITKPLARGRFVIKARGVNEAIASLEAAAATDPTAEKVQIFLMEAKKFGNAEPDGSFSWVVENPDGGLPRVNGQALPGGR